MNNIGIPLDVGQIKADIDDARLPPGSPDLAESPKVAKKGGKQGGGIIKRIRSMKGVGILSNRSAKDQGPVFHRFNLVYGFNGSGKSTLSRMFASLQAGELHVLLPDGCSFEIEMDDGNVLCTTALAGLEKRLCVFNADFITRHLQWEKGTASSIFYISQQQADVVQELRATETAIRERETAKIAAEKIVRERDKTLRTYCTERAKVIHGALHLGSRRYEAGHFKSDYENLPFDKTSILDPASLEALEDLARLSSPSPALSLIRLDAADIRNCVETARRLAELSIGVVVLDELERHPSMVPWMKTGNDYHTKQDLNACLLCGSELTADRKALLASALDDKISALLTELQDAQQSVGQAAERLSTVGKACPKATELDLTLQPEYRAAMSKFTSQLQTARKLMGEASRALAARLEQPTTTVRHGLPGHEQVAKALAALETARDEVNAVIDRHNQTRADFAKRQENARLAIRKHYLADGHGDYAAAKDAHAQAEAAVTTIATEIDQLNANAVALRAKVRQHGPAAEKITKMAHAYLGHPELTIVAANEGYELHRNGRLVRGAPSEGEKTALALCYFLCTLEAEGRVLKDLIIVVDDPISSLDTKAMNYACALLRNRLGGAAQVFVLTHNQHCMNEFKKAWKSHAYPKNKDTAPTAALLFLDVILPAAQGTRCSNLVEMPALLREYDSEYHFLFQKVLEFEAAGSTHFAHSFMMPNVIRRVLDVFLAFKVPGTAPLSARLDQLCKRHAELDAVRIAALERLSQVESHSDSLDDLIAHSSMTIEEARDANAALLALMSASDKEHLAAMRKQCRPSPAQN